MIIATSIQIAYALHGSSMITMFFALDRVIVKLCILYANRLCRNSFQIFFYITAKLGRWDPCRPATYISPFHLYKKFCDLICEVSICEVKPHKFGFYEANL